jgi:hypothetical protein
MSKIQLLNEFDYLQNHARSVIEAFETNDKVQIVDKIISMLGYLECKTKLRNKLIKWGDKDYKRILKYASDKKKMGNYRSYMQNYYKTNSDEALQGIIFARPYELSVVKDFCRTILIKEYADSIKEYLFPNP